MLFVAVSCFIFGSMVYNYVPPAKEAKTILGNILSKSKDTLVLRKSEADSLQRLGVAARDVAIYFKSHPDDIRTTVYLFKCGKYGVWIGNGASLVDITYPIEYELNDYEKQYFWKMYLDFGTRDTRYYNYESEIVIVVKNQNNKP